MSQPQQPPPINHWVFVDLDQTLVNTKRPQDAGYQPDRESLDKEYQTAPPIVPILALISALAAPAVFITNRRENFGPSTKAWCQRYGLKTFIVLRPEKEELEHGAFKEKWIKALTQNGNPSDTVTVIDDDPDGSVQAACQRNGWAHLKLTTHGGL